MQLLQINKGKLEISPQALGIKLFKKIWDKHKDKNKSIQELSYVYFMMDKTNEIKFWAIGDWKERSSKVIEHVFGKISKWKPDKDVEAVINFWKENMASYSEVFLEDVMVGADKIREYLRNVDLTDLDDKGKPIHDINKLRDLIQKVPDILKSISNLQKTIEEEQRQKSGKLGDRQKGMYEDEGMTGI